MCKYRKSLPELSGGIVLIPVHISKVLFPGLNYCHVSIKENFSIFVSLKSIMYDPATDGVYRGC